MENLRDALQQAISQPAKEIKGALLESLLNCRPCISNGEKDYKRILLEEVFTCLISKLCIILVKCVLV